MAPAEGNCAFFFGGLTTPSELDQIAVVGT